MKILEKEIFVFLNIYFLFFLISAYIEILSKVVHLKVIVIYLDI